MAKRTRTQTEIVSIRLSPEQRRTLADRASLCGRPFSTYIRETVLGKIPRARPLRIEKKAVYQLSRIGANLNQMARVANVTGRLEAERRIEETLGDITRAIKRLS